MTRTLSPRARASITAFKNEGSEKINIFTRNDFVAPSIASRMDCAESSGITINERDMRSPSDRALLFRSVGRLVHAEKLPGANSQATFSSAEVREHSGRWSHLHAI